jgi:hypothetical protein
MSNEKKKATDLPVMDWKACPQHYIELLAQHRMLKVLGFTDFGVNHAHDTKIIGTLLTAQGKQFLIEINTVGNANWVRFAWPLVVSAHDSQPDHPDLIYRLRTSFTAAKADRLKAYMKQIGFTFPTEASEQR